VNPRSLRKFEEVRERLGSSQERPADRLGVARTTVTRWENGTRRLSKVAEPELQSVIEAKEARPWQRLAGAALNELWDNAEDAVYDAWQERYGSGAP
jgi:DNA-binding XRE family transcriptional regulator